MTQIFDLIKLVAGSFGGSFAIVLGALFLAFWFYGKFVKMLTKHDGFERTCETLSNRVASVETGVNELKGEMHYVKSTLNSIVSMIQSSGSPLMQSHSPLSLTEFGESMAAAFGADVIISRCFNTIRAKIDTDVVAKTPYDVQTYCLEKIPVAPENYLDAEAINAIKTYAFNNGRTLFECLKVVGIKARDAYFKVTGLA